MTLLNRLRKRPAPTPEPSIPIGAVLVRLTRTGEDGQLAVHSEPIGPLTQADVPEILDLAAQAAREAL